MDFSNFLPQRRNKLGLTQMDLANQLSQLGYETSYGRVSHWETGRNKPPLNDRHFRQALATILKIDVNEMMEILGYVVNDDDRTPEAMQAADIVDQLPPERRKEVLARLQLELQLYLDQNLAAPMRG